MEIASVSLFDAVAATVEPSQGQPPEEPFRDCLGVALAGKSAVEGSLAEGESAPDLDREEAAASEPLLDTPARDEVGSLELSPQEAPPTEFIPEVEVTAPRTSSELPSVVADPERSSSVPVSSNPSTEPSPELPGTDPLPPTTHSPAEIFPVSEFADGETGPETPPTDAGPVVGQAPPGMPHGASIGTATTPEHTLSPTAAAPPLTVGVAPVEVRDVSPQQRNQSERVRTRASDEFQGRAGAERLWGYWLRNRGARPPGAVASAAQPGAAVGGEGAPRGVGNAQEWQEIVRLVNPAVEPAVEKASAGTAEALPRAAETRTEPQPNMVTPGIQTSPVAESEADVRTVPAARQPAAPPAPAPQQVANAVRVAVLKGGDRVTVQLQPETLGKVQVVLVRGDEGLSASFKVDNPLTQQALQADAPMLRQALEARGVNVIHVSVELEQGDRQHRDSLARHGGDRKRRFLGAEQDGELTLDDIALRPQAWRPWGFEARA